MDISSACCGAVDDDACIGWTPNYSHELMDHVWSMWGNRCPEKLSVQTSGFAVRLPS